jgi:Skp family chaperone for outer membrane proteins
MRGFVAVASFALTLSAVSTFAQTPAAPASQPATAQAAPAQQPPASTQPAAPAAPAQTVPAAPAAQPPVPFPQGAKFAYVNVPGIFQLSAAGKAAAAQVQALTTKKQGEIDQRTKALQAAQQKLQTGGTLMNEQARATLQKDIDRMTTELDRFRQDAEREVQELGTELQTQFEGKLLPLLRDIAVERGLQMLFSAADSGLIWAEPGLDLTMDAVKKLDAVK